MKQLAKTAFVLACLCVTCSPCCGTVEDYPFMGDWEGRWNRQDGVYPPRIAAQVRPWKDGRYEIRLFTELRKGAPEYVAIEAQPAGGVLHFKHGSWSGSIEGDRFTGEGTLRDKHGRFEMKRVFYESSRLNAKPPAGALVLFDGSDFDQWERIGRDGKIGPVAWEIDGGAMRIVPETGNHQIGASIGTKRTFYDLGVTCHPLPCFTV